MTRVISVCTSPTEAAPAATPGEQEQQQQAQPDEEASGDTTPAAEALDYGEIVGQFNSDEGVSEATWAKLADALGPVFGLDKDAAMYLYPYEGHGPAAEDTLLDLWARWTAWLDKYLVDGEPQRNVISQGGSGS